LIEFGRQAAAKREKRGCGKPETFIFLGFTFICGKSRKGRFLIRRKTRADRMQVTLRRIKEELRWRMHESIPEQGRWLGQVVRGYFAYHAVPTNRPALRSFLIGVTERWKHTLSRRSQRGKVTWERMTKIANDGSRNRAFCILGLASASTLNTQGGSRVPGIGLARFCAGGVQQWAFLPRSQFRTDVTK